VILIIINRYEIFKRAIKGRNFKTLYKNKDYQMKKTILAMTMTSVLMMAHASEDLG
jgi:hypothetical protein